VLILIAVQTGMQIIGMAMQVAFYAAAAYYVARYARKGWNAGKE